MRKVKPLPLLITATLLTTGISWHQYETITEAESVIEDAKKTVQVLGIEPVKADIPASDPVYTEEMDVSWHTWHPEGKAAGVVPVALLELAEEYNINPVYAAAVFVLETGWGSSSAWLNKHNPAGIRCGDRYCSYSTATEGLRRMFEVMQDYYTNGLTTVAQQRNLWSESDDTDTVVQLMCQLAEGR